MASGRKLVVGEEKRRREKKVACKLGKIWDRDKARDDVETSSSREGSVYLAWRKKGQPKTKAREERWSVRRPRDGIELEFPG